MIKYIDRKTGKFIIENPPAVGMLKFIYGNPLGQLTLLPLVNRKFVSAWYGRQMNKPQSVDKIQGFVDSLNIDMSESILNVKEFSTFNDFFYRKLKPEARPIQDGFVSPGDGRLLAFEKISDLSSFFIKGNQFTLKAFLKDEKLAQKYEDGNILILRLAPNDYHRFHFPYEGRPTPITEIKGGYLSVSPIALASNFTKVFCENKREYTILNTSEIGDVLLAPVGATMVGSIIETFKPNQQISKGDEMGYFAFGGSTIVVLLEKDQIKIDADILENSKNGHETYVKMGEQIGTCINI